MRSKESGKVRYAYGVAMALLLGGTAFSLATGQAGAQVAQNAPTAMAPRAGAPMSFADLVAQLQPAVVNISTKQRVPVRAQGAKQAQIIRAQADADASKTYAASFGKDPQFYDFYRAMQSYLTTFVGDGQDKPAPTNIILSPQNDYLKEFSGRTK